MNYYIKKLEAGDWPLAMSLMQLWKEAQSKEQPSKEYLIRLLENPAYHIFVALQDDQLVGGLTAYELEMFTREEREMFLYEIGVEEAYQERGVGTALIEALKDTCAKNGISIIFVGTTISNEAARSLYQKTGGLEEINPWYTYHLV